MKVYKIFIAFIVLFSLSLLFLSKANAEMCPISNQDPCWIEKESMPIPRWSMGGASDLNGKIYVVGGYDGNGSNFYDNLDIYNTLNNTWTSKSPAPLEVNSPGFSYSFKTNKFYIVGGLTFSGPTNHVYEYDPNNDFWTQKNPLPVAIHQFKLIEAPDGKLYAIGGVTSFNCPGNIYKFDTSSGNWSYVTTMPTQRCDPAAVIDSNGIIYTFGGSQDSRFGFNKTRTVEAYNISNNAWETKASIPLSNYNNHLGAIFNSQGKIYLISGDFINTSNQIQNLAYEYDQIFDSWNSVSPLPIGRSSFVLAFSNNKVYAIGGSDLFQPIVIPSVFEGFKPQASPPIQDINLNVPLIKQTSEPWASQIYDKANIWNPQDSSVNAWGCALTSAAMVFKYHGINKLPGNTNLDPETLNNWLKKQKDGYIGNGLVNWIALSRLSKQAVGLNHIKIFDALEFNKIHSNDKNIVFQDLQNNIPDILGVPGHFIVARGISNNIISINDPGFNRNSLSDYSNTFSTINRFTPSNTDLSYIMIATQNNIEVELKDDDGTKLGDYFIEEGINNLTNPSQNNGDPVKIILLPKPEEQNFNIVLNSLSNTAYELEIYLYNVEGDVLKETKTGTLLTGLSQTIPLYFDAQEEIYPRKISFGKFGSDLSRAFRDEQIDSDLFNQLNTIFDEANNLRRDKQDPQVLEKLVIFEEVLTQNYDTIPEDTYKTLLYDVNYLTTHL